MRLPSNVNINWITRHSFLQKMVYILIFSGSYLLSVQTARTISVRSENSVLPNAQILRNFGTGLLHFLCTKKWHDWFRHANIEASTKIMLQCSKVVFRFSRHANIELVDQNFFPLNTIYIRSYIDTKLTELS